MRVRIVHDMPSLLSDFFVEVEALPPIGSEVIVNGAERVVTRVAQIIHVEKNGDAQFRGYVVTTKNKRVSSLG